MYLLGQEARAWHLFLICHLYIHEVPTKHPREKSLDLRKYPPEKIWTHNIPIYPREKIRDQRRYGSTMARRLRDSQWHEIHGI